MSRLLVLLSAAVVPFAVAPAAPVPPEAKKPGLYFPTKVGTKLVYQAEGEKHERVEVVMEVEDKDGAKIVTMGFLSRGKVEPHNVVSVSDKGLCIVDTNVSDLDEPMWLLKLPHKDGNKWDFVIAPAAIGKWKGTAVASGPDKVEVPAGKFEAIRVELDITFAGDRTRITTWYAPGVGNVKEIHKSEFNERVEVLKSFTPGKD